MRWSQTIAMHLDEICRCIVSFFNSRFSIQTQIISSGTQAKTTVTIEFSVAGGWLTAHQIPSLKKRGGASRACCTVDHSEHFCPNQAADTLHQDERFTCCILPGFTSSRRSLLSLLHRVPEVQASTFRPPSASEASR